MGEVIAPHRSYQQRMEALLRANDVRTKRAKLKRAMKSGRRDAAEVLENPPEEAETMKIIDFLVSLPKIGRVKANKWLSQCKMSPSKTLGGMTERQRRELAVLLRARNRVGAVRAQCMAAN